MRRLAIVAGIAALSIPTAAALLPSPAAGHAVVEATEPDNGALLEESPAQILISLSEPPDLSLTTVGVVDAAGSEVATGPVELATGENRTIRVRLDDLPDGVYTVTWRTVSTVDAHLTSDAFSFGVGVTPREVAPVEGGTRQETPPPTFASVAGRWALYVGLAALIGAALAGLLAFGPSWVARPPALLGAWALAAVGVVVMTLQERSTIGVPLGTLLESDTGASFIRLGVAVAVVGSAAVAVSVRTNTATLILLAAATCAAAFVRATGGHAGASTVQTLLQGIHVVAIGAWIGGLVWLSVGLARGIDAERVRRFSTIAGLGLAAVFVSGLLRASNELGGVTWWLHAFDNGYGTTLLLKLAAVGVLVALGAVNRYRNVRRFEELGPRPMLRTVGGELVLAAGVFALAGVLTGLPPQGGRAPAPASRPAERLVVTGSDFATTTNVRLEISPGTVGPNEFVAEITDYDTGEPVDARLVTLSFGIADRPEVSSELGLEPSPDGTWRAAGTSLSLGGTWTVDVLIEQAEGSVEVPLEVTPVTPQPRIEVSRQEGQPDLYTISIEGGASLQVYVDPGVPGQTNQVHMTAFDANGSELRLHHAIVAITPPGGEEVVPRPIRLSPGHFAANVEIEPGTSSFALDVLIRDGRTLVASFEQTFEG